MTREDSKHPMELDLDAFLLSLNTTNDEEDDDDDDNDHHRSTVDQLLLNDSDGSSPSSSPRSYIRDSGFLDFSKGRSPKSNINPADVNSLEALRLTPSPVVVDRDFPTTQSNLGSSINRSNSDDTFSVSRQLPPFFGAVRSNAKPGAALAAAAAASRSIPTPHAAAIKLRREKLGTEGLESKASTGSETIYQSDTGSEMCQPDAKLVEEDARLDNLETLGVDAIEKPEVSGEVITEVTRNHLIFTGEVVPCEEMPADVANDSKVGEVELDVGYATLVSDDEPEITFPLNIEAQNSGEDNPNAVIVDSSNEPVEDNGMKSAPMSPTRSIEVATEVEEDSTTALSKTIDYESIKPSEKDIEFGLARAGDNDMAETDLSVNTGGMILHQESKRSDESSGDRSRSSPKPLVLAEELEKKLAFTGLHWEEGAAAQPMKLEGVRRGSTVLGYFDISTDNTITRTISSPAFRRDHGTPQAVAVHLSYIAVGTSRGVIIVVPSKYSPHYADKMDAKMLMLGLQGDRSYAPVTSLSFNQQGDLLFAGYADGHYTVWDVQRVSAVKVVTEHKAPVVHMLYLGMDSQVTRQFNVVSGDSKGVVKLIRFSPFSWLNRFSTSKTSTLLDESTSTVVCASPLLSDEGFGGPSTTTPVATSSIGSMMGGVVAGDWKPFEGLNLAEEGVVIFVTHQSALVAKVSSSTPEVYAQLPKPDGIREGSMPYSAWKHIAHLQGSAVENEPIKESETVPLLAIAWDHQVQVARLVKSELKIYAKWTLDSSAIGVAWLDDQMLVVLTSAAQLFLYAKDGTVIHQTNFAVDGCRGDDLIGYHSHFNNIFGNPEKAHHNYIAVRGATLYLLGPTHLIISRLLPWKERIEVLRKAGDWMGALNMAMTLYDGQAHGVFDLPRALNDVQKAIMPYLVELLFAYVDEVFSYISVAFCNQIEKLEHLDSTSGSTSVHSEIKEQYTRVGGVAVEFCVHIRRTDILFDEILSRFESVQQKETFLELLEPYILKDMLGSLPPEIMQVLVEHYSAKGWLQRVEQCVLHMDISSLDFNQVVRLCREHRLYGALIYLFNKGLDDFRTPLEELLVVLRNSDSKSAAALGYRMLVYLKYCFSGLAFPPGHGALSHTRLPSLRMELIHFLLEDTNARSLWGATCLSSTEQYKNLYHLLELDTEATLEVLRCAFIEEEIPKLDDELAVENDSISQSQNLVQKIVDALAFILEASRSLSSRFVQAKTIWPSKDDTSYILDFISHYVGCGDAKVSNELLGQIFEYLTSVVNIPLNVSRQSIDSLRTREKKVLAVLEVVPETDWDDTYLLCLCEKAQFYQVCGFIHESRQHYIAALESYMKDVDEPLHAFSFIDDLFQRLSDKNPHSLEAAVISRIPDLVQISREGTFFLLVQHFSQENQQILAELRSYPKSLFLHLKTVLEVHSTGTLNFSSLRNGHSLNIPGRRRVKNQSDRVQEFLGRISDFPKFLRDNPVHVTDEMTEMYLELLCQYERNSVLQFLETCESYRVEHCLRLCQEHGIIDAAAFLLERVGDVGSALQFTLSDLMDKFRLLDAAVQRVLDCAGMDHFNAVLKKEEVNDILYIVRTSVGLCQRNSPRLDPDESEALWFQLLDSFCEPLMDSCVSKMNSEDENQKRTSTELPSRQKDREACKSNWKVNGSNKGAHILRKLFSIFIKEIVEGMIGFVRLPAIMMKLLSDNGSQEFGDFKVTILGMLGTYDFERRILDTAKSLIEDDTYYTMRLLKKGASHGYGPQSLLCCICNCLLTKESSTSGIRVFSCGHASHLHCELQAKETSHRGPSTGCPICMPKKKGPRSKSNSVFAENGLVTKPFSKNKLSQGTGAAHLHENDALDRQISRFEILSNLQKDHRMIQIDNLPQLRLAPPAVYHDKVKKGIDILRGESSSSNSAKVEKTKVSKKVRDLKVKGSAVRFPLKSNIFGKEKTNKQ